MNMRNLFRNDSFRRKELCYCSGNFTNAILNGPTMIMH